MIRILAGTICKQVPEVLQAHLETMRWQRTDHTKTDLVYVDDNDDEASRDLLRRTARTLSAGERGAAEYGVGEFTHGWNIAAFHRLAREKQRLLELAVAERYDYVFLVDSDLLLAPSTLQSLLDANAPIASAVFWTRWTPADRPLPQVWQQHPYGFDAAGWTEQSFLAALRDHQRVRVRGLGACTLISVDALRAGCGFWPLLGDLPADGMWQGEDRHFCVRAERLHVPMVADAWPEVWHCYRPSQRAELTDQLARLRASSKDVAEFGDWVSLAIEPLEEPALIGHVEHVRGRLGALALAGAIENALVGMRVRDSQFLRVPFEDRERLVRVRLLDVRAI